MPSNAQLEQIALGAADRTTLVHLWNRVLELMQVQTTRQEFDTWVRRTALLSIASRVAALGVSSAFFKEGFEHRYGGAVYDVISELYTPINYVRLVITRAGCSSTNALPSSA